MSDIKLSQLVNKKVSELQGTSTSVRKSFPIIFKGVIMKSIIILLCVTFVNIFIGCANNKLTVAKLYIQNKNYENAKYSLEDLVAENEANGNEGNFKNAEAYYYLGVVRCELGEYDGGLTAFNNSQKISTRYDDNIRDSKNYYYAILFNEGVSDYENKYYEDALDKFKTALAFKPNDPDALKNIAYIKKAGDEKTNGKTEHQKYETDNDSSEIKYSGNGIQNTRPFRTVGAWEVNWYSKGDIFQIYLYNTDGEMLEILSSQSKAGEGSSYYPNGGTYYLKVNAADDWEIKIHQVE